MYPSLYRCVINDTVIFNGVNLTNGLRETYVINEINIPMFEASLILLMLNFIILIYGKKIYSFLYNLWTATIEWENDE